MEESLKLYGQSIHPFLLLVPNLLLRGEPHEIRALAAILIVFFEITDYPHPCLVGSLSFEQTAVPDRAFEVAHSSTNDLVGFRIIIIVGFGWVDPFPRVVFETELIVGIFAVDTSMTKVLTSFFDFGQGF